MKEKYKSIIEFLDKSKSAYHAVKNISDILIENGYERLFEGDDWNLNVGGKYFVIRNGSSVIAFRNNGGSFMIGSAHSDSPSFRVKSDMKSGAYLRLDTEKYGGMIYYSWLDRPLAISGRAMVRTEGGVESRLFVLDKNVVIPSLAIHMNRGVNESCKLNPAQDLIPLASVDLSEGTLVSMIENAVNAENGAIVSHETFLSNDDKPTPVGLNDEFLLASRLDDLSAAYAALVGFINAAEADSTPVLAVFDNEEVGSETKQGAASTFLYDVLSRICRDSSDYKARLASSFMVSADNAHAIHPNHPEMADRNNAPTLGGGVVVKYNANQRYATDAFSDAVFREICSRASVKVQSYYNRADLPGGSTLGSISDTCVSVPTVDIGIPQLAMHSANELCAFSDIDAMLNAMKQFFSTNLTVKGEKVEIK